jgi:N-acetylglucosamine-6-phosphate deacetylase
MRADPDQLTELGLALARDGVLSYQPTVMTARVDVMRDALIAIGRAAHADTGLGAEIVGAHLEGPFLAATRAGAHHAGHLRDPSLELLLPLLEAGCPVTMVTLAPELPGAATVVQELVARGIVASVGHTEATATCADAAFDLGVSAATHLYNAMRAFAHRDPGVVGVTLVREDVTPMLIADGVHVDPVAIRLAWRAARHRLVLVSDAMAGARAGDGLYTLGSSDVTVAGGVARRWDGTLAGSTAPLVAGLRTLMELGAPTAEAVDCVTRTPGRLIGRPDLGVLRPGLPADLVVLEDDLSIRTVLRDGVPVI